MFWKEKSSLISLILLDWLLYFHFDRSEDGKILSEITEIELWRDDTGLGSDWFCDAIFLLDLEAGILVSNTVYEH